MDHARLIDAVRRFEAWFETMRCPAPQAGYGGPVAHWWQNNLQFTGAGLDWRYEGILHGYLNLQRATGEAHWLAKAMRAGDDLIAGQRADGGYADSNFEHNPHSLGRPHEAAVACGLGALALHLRAAGDAGWTRYAAAQERGLYGAIIPRLWNGRGRRFDDSPGDTTFVPNKAATICEALFLYADLHDDTTAITTYILPTLDAICAFQVPASGGALAGAIYQNELQGRRVARFMPYYAARAVPALLRGYQFSDDRRYLDAALNAMRFCYRWRDDDGAFAQMIYGDGGVNRYPRWITGAADIVGAGDLLVAHGFDGDPTPTRDWILNGQHANGGIGTAHGFGAQISQRLDSARPEFRDVLPVCGWADKAFRYLTGLLPAGAIITPAPPPERIEIACSVRGQAARYVEDAAVMEVWRGETAIYRWNKGERWAAVCAPEMVWK
jgi:hypothetical protein